MNLSQSQINRIPIEWGQQNAKVVSSPAPPTRGIFAEKLADHLRKTPAFRLFRQMSGFFTFAIVAITLISPATGGWMILKIVSGGGFIAPKIAFAWLVVKNWRKLAYIPHRIRNFAQRRRKRGKMIDGVPTAELVDYLVRNQSFKREGVNGARATFGLNMENFNKLALNLEKCGVLERGENNLRVLAARWNRQTLLEFFAGKKKSNELIGGWLRVRGGEKVRLNNTEIKESETAETLSHSM